MENGFQLVLPLDCTVNIPEDHPVRLLNAVMERLDYSKLNAAYSRLGRIEYPPKILAKILVYGYMRQETSSRVLEACCRENINYMYLLEGQRAPDHNTINRFRNKVLNSEAGEDLLTQLAMLIHENGLLSFEACFIDGTKIEANANKYSFVWKKGTEKQLKKLYEKIHEELPERLKNIGISFDVPEQIQISQLEQLEKQIKAEMDENGIQIVTGKGKHKSELQRVYEKVLNWIERLKKYLNNITICGDRNSFSKTDQDATFMRMKEDHMLNGQLKPGYNVNVATCSEFIIGNYISSDRNDVHTLIPFVTKLDGMYEPHNVTIGSYTADSGYESEENYCWFEDNKPNTELYIKPLNYEVKKHKKYRTDISRRENMKYDPEKDTYTCANGKELKATHEKHSKSASTGIELTTTVYECSECSGCPLKEKCIRSCGSKKSLDERHKVLYVSKRFARQREAMEEKMSTEEGKLHRINRTIQAEGTFAYTKEDLGIRRFSLRGKENVAAEWNLFSLALNVLRLHHKIQKNRLGAGLVVPYNFPAGL